MTCGLEQDYIQAYLDGELSREERKEMALHLQSCPGCREELQNMLRAGKQEPFSADMQIDVAQFEAFAQQLGTAVALDPKLNKESIFISFGQSSFIEYSSESNPQARLHYAVSASPQLKVPEGIDVDQVRGALLMTPLLPENVRQQLANIQDWESTLPIPYVEGQDYSEDVKVQGNPGVFVAYAGGEHAFIPLYANKIIMLHNELFAMQHYNLFLCHFQLILS